MNISYGKDFRTTFHLSLNIFARSYLRPDLRVNVKLFSYFLFFHNSEIIQKIFHVLQIVFASQSIFFVRVFSFIFFIFIYFVTSTNVRRKNAKIFVIYRWNNMWVKTFFFCIAIKYFSITKYEILLYSLFWLFVGPRLRNIKFAGVVGKNPMNFIPI